jgi:SAM-dependent methyltransferase
MHGPSGVLLSWSKCQACGFTFMNPKLALDEVLRTFNSDEYWKHGNYGDYLGAEDVRLENSRLRVKHLSCFVPPPALLLDIGTATGSFAAAAHEVGYDVIGIDPAREMIAFGRERYGLDLRVQAIEHCHLPRDTFDAISLLGTDSHFYDPRESFGKLAGWLKPKGHLLFNYQDYDHWIRRIFPKVKRAANIYYNFTRRSLPLFMEQLGFEILDQKTEIQVTQLHRVTRIIGLGSGGLGPLANLKLKVPTVSYYLLVARKRE